MFPALKHFLTAFFTDETSFIRGVRAIIAALALGGMGYAQEVSDALGAPGAVKTIKTISLVCMGLSLMLGAGDKTTPATVTDALAKASPDDIKHAIEHRADEPKT